MTKHFQNLADFISEMNSSNSTNHKIDILKKYSGDTFICDVLKYTYHPYKQYGVTSANLKKRSDLTAVVDVYDNLFYLLDDLADRNITGHTAIEAVNNFIAKYSKFDYLIYQIIDRNLETRATTSLINRVFPGLIPTFDVALAYDFTKVKKVNLADGTWYISRKLDGVRCITIIRNNSIKFFSRNGKEFETLGKVREEIERLGLTDCVLDGEICMMNNDGTDDFQGILKQIQRKEHTIQKPRYWVFDCLTLEEFDSGRGEEKLQERRQRHIFTDSTILATLPQTRVYTEHEVLDFRQMAKAHGWEGLIARRDVGYEGDRTKNMLKIKEFFDAEYRVIETIIGPQRVIVNELEVEETMLSAVIIEHKGNRVQVGSGFSIAERREYYSHPEKIVDGIITVTYFEETTDQHGNNSLRFPVFKINHGKTRSI